MTEAPGRRALLAALAAPRRHAAALVLIAAAVGIAALVGSRVAFYGAALVAFAIWMAWFVLTAIAWLERADF